MIWKSTVGNELPKISKGVLNERKLTLQTEKIKIGQIEISLSQFIADCSKPMEKYLSMVNDLVR